MMYQRDVPGDSIVDTIGPKVIQVTPGPIVNLDIVTGTMVANAYWVVSQNVTINAIGTQIPFQRLNITVDVSTLATVTFGTGFRTGGALVGLLSKTISFSFSSIGGKFVETNRYTIPLL